MEKIAVSSGERFEYEPREGWNLELSFDGESSVEALYRFVKYGNYVDLSPTPDDTIPVKRGEYTALKVACDIEKARFIINPHDIPGAGWEELKAYTVEELAFHLEGDLPPYAKEMLGLMRYAREVLGEFDQDMWQAKRMILDPIFEEAEIVYPITWNVDYRGGQQGLIRGFEVERHGVQLYKDYQPVDRLVEVLNQNFPGHIEHEKWQESWNREGEYQERWIVSDPDKLLEMLTGLSHSSIILTANHRLNTSDYYNFYITVAKGFPLERLFSIFEDKQIMLKDLIIRSRGQLKKQSMGLKK